MTLVTVEEVAEEQIILIEVLEVVLREKVFLVAVVLVLVLVVSLVAAEVLKNPETLMDKVKEEMVLEVVLVEQV